MLKSRSLLRGVMLSEEKVLLCGEGGAHLREIDCARRPLVHGDQHLSASGGGVRATSIDVYAVSRKEECRHNGDTYLADYTCA